MTFGGLGKIRKYARKARIHPSSRAHTNGWRRRKNFNRDNQKPQTLAVSA